MSTSRSATLIDVARLAGVSKTTASDALSSSGRVAEATRMAVLEAAERLGYSPNTAARNLRSGSTGTVAVYVPDTPTRSPYFMEFIMGVLAETSSRDLDLTVMSSGGKPEGKRVPRVDGIILADPAAGDVFVSRVLDSRIPVVTGESVLSIGTADGVVRSDYFGAIQELLEHLWNRGATSPGMLLPELERNWVHQLQRGYDDWCAEKDISSRVQRIPFSPDAAAVRNATEKLLSTHPEVDGFVTAPGGTIGFALPALIDRGLTIGEDILVATCSDSPELSVMQPPITAVDARPREAGELCARLLLDVLGGEVDRGTEIALPLNLVPRASTGLVAGDYTPG